MTVKYEVKVTAVGKDARPFLDSNKSFILMDENLRPNLADMVVQHTVAEVAGDIAEGDKLLVGNTDFIVEKVGAAANANLRNGGHCTVVVNGTATMPGQIAVKGNVMPRLRAGDTVKFYSE